jgi:hypothetical protein
VPSASLDPGEPVRTTNRLDSAVCAGVIGDHPASRLAQGQWRGGAERVDDAGDSDGRARIELRHPRAAALEWRCACMLSITASRSPNSATSAT